MLAQPVWARLTDRYSNKSTVLLWAALLGESIIEVFMFAIPGNNYGVVLSSLSLNTWIGVNSFLFDVSVSIYEC